MKKFSLTIEEVNGDSKVFEFNLMSEVVDKAMETAYPGLKKKSKDTYDALRPQFAGDLSLCHECIDNNGRRYLLKETIDKQLPKNTRFVHVDFSECKKKLPKNKPTSFLVRYECEDDKSNAICNSMQCYCNSIWNDCRDFADIVRTVMDSYRLKWEVVSCGSCKVI